MDEAVATQTDTGTGADSGIPATDVENVEQTAAAEGTETETAQADTTEGTEATAEGEATESKAEGEGDAAGFTAEALNFPESFNVDEGNLNLFTEVATKHDLTPEAAQDLADLFVSVSEGQSQGVMDAYQAQVQGWAEATEKDAELGGKGEVFDQKLSTAKKALDMFASDELKNILNAYDAETNPQGMGLGNNPEVIRLFYRLGKNVGEDGLVLGDTVNSEQDRESILYN